MKWALPSVSTEVFLTQGPSPNSFVNVWFPRALRWQMLFPSNDMGGRPRTLTGFSWFQTNGQLNLTYPNTQVKTHVWYTAYNAGRIGVDYGGATPFWRAAYSLDVTAMRLLHEHGADPDIVTYKPASRRFGFNRGGNNDEEDPSGLPPVAPGGPAVHPLHAATGVGYGTSRVGQQHVHVPDGWLPAVEYLVGELGVDVNVRDHDGYSAMHNAAARGDNAVIQYLADMGADPTFVSRRGQTTVDMANGPQQRVQPFPETMALLEGMGAINNDNCQSC